MATIPPVTAPQNSSSKASPTDWILETQAPGPDGKIIQQTFKVTLGKNQTITAQFGAQYKLTPVVKAAKGKNKKLLDADQVIPLQEGNDLRLMLPGGGVIFIKGFFDPAHKAAPTQLKITQTDGSQELLASGSPVPAPAQPSVPEVDSMPSDSSTVATQPTPIDEPFGTAVKYVAKSKSKGKKPNGIDDIDWMGGFDVSSLGGLFALAGLGGGGGSGGTGALWQLADLCSRERRLGQPPWATCPPCRRSLPEVPVSASVPVVAPATAVKLGVVPRAYKVTLCEDNLV